MAIISNPLRLVGSRKQHKTKVPNNSGEAHLRGYLLGRLLIRLLIYLPLRLLARTKATKNSRNRLDGPALSGYWTAFRKDSKIENIRRRIYYEKNVPAPQS